CVRSAGLTGGGGGGFRILSRSAPSTSLQLTVSGTRFVVFVVLSVYDPLNSTARGNPSLASNVIVASPLRSSAAEVPAAGAFISYRFWTVPGSPTIAPRVYTLSSVACRDTFGSSWNRGPNRGGRGIMPGPNGLPLLPSVMPQVPLISQLT